LLMMEYGELALRGGRAFLQLAANPFYYAGIVFIILQYRRQMMLERKLFHTRLHSVWDRAFTTTIWGWVGGIAVSILMGWIGATLTPSTVIFVWIISAIMAVWRIRFLCFAYAIGFLGIVHGILSMIPPPEHTTGWHDYFGPLPEFDIPPLLVIVALLHFAEAMLVRFQGQRAAVPMFYESKRGKIVGGYHLQEFWPVPLFLLVPMEGGSVSALPWTPLFGDGLWSDGWTIAAFPVMMGFSAATITRLPAEKTRRASAMLVTYAAFVLLLAAVASLGPVWTVFASVFCIVLHEAVIWFGRWEEQTRSPLFVHSSQGVKILAVLPGSPASELGIQAGEIVHKVNGVRVRTKEELHRALQINPAFCKLEIINLQGHSKFVQRAIFSGDHHQLGIVLCPDEQALYYMAWRDTSLWSYFRSKMKRAEQRNGHQTARHL